MAKGLFAFRSSGNCEAYGDVLRAQHIRVITEGEATLVARGFSDIYGIGVGSRNFRRGDSTWLLGYQEYPFRAISSYEEVREAYYYRLETDASGFVIRGSLVTDILERRKMR